MKSILDPTFTYYSSVDTDLRRTFRKVRQEMREIRGTRTSLPQAARPVPIVHLVSRRRAPIAG